ncbi:MAG: putative DNA binding domain-containing protein [Bacteroidales bacterium]|nr:putative DNA binding domain-containing protein [Bacteroidales bacterium]MDY0143128.1 putative DNA binding domain-containing protein [Bacteroidales bacterium]
MPTKNLNSILQLGEGQFIEFKENLDKSLAKEIVAFANASGGAVYIGVTDSGNLKGLSISNKIKSQIQDIAYNCDPAINIKLEEINNILAIYVTEGVNKPYSCSSGFYMRMGANSQKMTRNEILSLAIKTGKVRYDEQICDNFEWKDFDDEKFEYYLKIAGISKNMPREDILKNLRVLTNDGFTIAGALYFAKEPFKYIISSKIRCVHFNDDERIDILDKKVVDRGIIGNIEFAVNFLKDIIPVRYEIKDLNRKEFPEYPIEAYREAIVNAIIHFDYFLGDTIAIEKLKNSIIINNKGELLFPKDEFGKKSEARNRLLVDLLARTNFMEKAGTGIKRVSDACISNGNRVDFDFSDSFWITMHSNNLDANLDKVVDKVVEKVPENVGDDVTKDVGKDVGKGVGKDVGKDILLIIENQANITIPQIAQILKLTERTIERHISKLKKENKIYRVGGRKSGFWEIIGRK